MKKLVSILLNILILNTFNSCVSQSYLKNAEKEGPMLEKEITLIITREVGNHGHIIHISRDGNLTYKIGYMASIPYVSNNYSNDNTLVDKKYSEFKKRLNSSTILKLSNLIKDESLLLYYDKLTLTDTFQHFLYINGKKTFLGYGVGSPDFNKYPSNVRTLMKLILKETGKLHDVPGGGA